MSSRRGTRYWLWFLCGIPAGVALAIILYTPDSDPNLVTIDEIVLAIFALIAFAATPLVVFRQLNSRNRLLHLGSGILWGYALTEFLLKEALGLVRVHVVSSNSTGAELLQYFVHVIK